MNAAPAPHPNIIPFPSRSPRTMRCVGEGVYQDPRTAAYYWRPSQHGRRAWRRLAARTERLAKREAGKLYYDLELHRRGLAPSPLVTHKTLADLLRLYVDAQCPRARPGAVRSPRELAAEQKHAAKLTAWPASSMPAKDATLELCRAYRDWRVKQISGGGDRQVDKELVTLSNAFRHAARHSTLTGITANPLAGRESFRDAARVRHCRDLQPADAAELHAHARLLFEHPASEVLAWQMLFSAFTGQRCHEMVQWRWDAPDRNTAGFRDSKHLWLWQSNTHKGTYPYADIHAALRQCLTFYADWRDRRHITSCWYFPSPQDARKHVTPSALTHALRRTSALLKLPLRTAHGLRSYHVNVLRSQGTPDAEIALRIGHRTGGRLIVQVYGEILPITLTWLPDTAPPAWEKWTHQANCVQLNLL